jgi:hypothetical protein
MTVDGAPGEASLSFIHFPISTPRPLSAVSQRSEDNAAIILYTYM